MSQDVCPWNVRFAQMLKETAFAAREVLAMTREEFSSAFKNSPMKRAKLRGLKRNAAVVLGNLRTTSHAESAEITEVLTRALEDTEALVREHAAWALARVRQSAGGLAPSASGGQTLEARIATEWREVGVDAEPARREVVGHRE
jgi:epoxyqueuosine reductase